MGQFFFFFFKFKFVSRLKGIRVEGGLCLCVYVCVYMCAFAGEMHLVSKCTFMNKFSHFSV